MKIAGPPFGTVDWNTVERTTHAGETLSPGMSYHVADGAEPHRSSTATGAKLYVVD